VYEDIFASKVVTAPTPNAWTRQDNSALIAFEIKAEKRILVIFLHETGWVQGKEGNTGHQQRMLIWDQCQSH
jgi:hypothetical protein